MRLAIRKRDAIPEKNCAGCEDCCCAFFCNSCTQCMILRHECKGNYSITSPTGVVAGAALV